MKNEVGRLDGSDGSQRAYVRIITRLLAEKSNNSGPIRYSLCLERNVCVCTYVRTRIIFNRTGAYQHQVFSYVHILATGLISHISCSTSTNVSALCYRLIRVTLLILGMAYIIACAIQPRPPRFLSTRGAYTT